MRKTVLKLSLLSILYTLTSFAQSSELGHAGTTGIAGQPGASGRNGRHGSTEYLIFNNNLDVDALQMRYAYEDFIRIKTDRALEWEKQSQGFLEAAMDIILNHSLDDKWPTLQSGELDRAYLLCFAAANDMAEIIASAPELKLVLPEPETCKKIIAVQRSVRIRPKN